MRKYTRKKREFLLESADWTVTILNRPELHRFVEVIQRRESISIDSLRDIRVIVLPPLYRVRGVLHGTLHPETKQVSIYPVVPQYGRFRSSPDYSIKTWGETIAEAELREELTRLVTETLFHELLHLKYPNGERVVRKLAGEYFREYMSLPHSRPG